MRDLAIWSFLMASAHGAGLMALPFIPQAAPPIAEAHAITPIEAHGHAAHEHAAPAHAPRGLAPADQVGHAAHLPSAAGGGMLVGLLAMLIHTLGYLFVTGVVAALVYYRLGLGVLQRAWVNLDVIWAAALIATGLLIPLF
jgi:hypothetical protein